MPNTRHGPVVSRTEDGEKFRLIKKPGRGSASAAAKLKQLDPDPTPCIKCKKPFSVKTNELGIRCDRCNAWYHQNCTSITKPQFKILDEATHDEFKWFCANCQTVPEPGTAFAQQAIKLEALTQVVCALQQQNKLILELLQREKVGGIGREEDIKVHVSEYLDDQAEKELKKNNLILWNLPESPEEEEEVAEREDLEKVREVLKWVNPRVDLDKMKVFRAGYRTKDRKPRPVKITLNSVETKHQVLRKSKKLKESDSFDKLGLSADKTKKEQIKYKELKVKRDELRKENGGDYVIFREVVMLRKDIPDFIKKSRDTATAGASSSGGSQ